MGADIGPMFADRRFHQYYYEVEQEFVLPEREEYHAKAGYTGLTLSMSLRRKFNQLSILWRITLSSKTVRVKSSFYWIVRIRLASQ